MSRYTTVVIRMPEDEDGKKKVREGLALIQPFQTAMSLEDEMTLLELIQSHDDFDSWIEDEARAKLQDLHAAFEATAQQQQKGQGL